MCNNKCIYKVFEDCLMLSLITMILLEISNFPNITF